VEGTAAGEDPSACKLLEEPGMVEGCEGLWVRNRLASHPDPALCEQMKDEKLVADCKREAWSRTIEHEISQVSAMILGLAGDSDGAGGSGSIVPPKPAPALASDLVHEQGPLSVRSVALSPRNPMEARLFTRFEGPELGIDRSARFSPLQMRAPFVTGRGVATGDFNGDGWSDLALATERGVLLYQNTGDGRFARVPHAVPEFEGKNVFNVAFVDIDDDGLLDVFAASYADDNLVVYNDGRGFQNPRVERFPPNQRVLTHSAGFGDLDRDGRLDIVEGNWSYGATKSFIAEFSHNRVLYNRGGSFEAVRLSGKPAETLSVLISDIDADGWPDVFTGNDQDGPDFYYFGGPGGLSEVFPEMGVFPATPTHTMSLDTADMNNDGHLDLLATDMSFAPDEVDDYCAAIVNEAERLRCNEILDQLSHVRNRRMEGCVAEPEVYRTDCMLAVMIELASVTKDAAICEGDRTYKLRSRQVR
jgi:hypothetical protein